MVKLINYSLITALLVATSADPRTFEAHAMLISTDIVIVKLELAACSICTVSRIPRTPTEHELTGCFVSATQRNDFKTVQRTIQDRQRHGRARCVMRPIHDICLKPKIVTNENRAVAQYSILISDLHCRR